MRFFSDYAEVTAFQLSLEDDTVAVNKLVRKHLGLIQDSCYQYFPIQVSSKKNF